jgi:prepilin-type N-terminal cleavage/methylation domain-containing protein
MNKNRTSRGFTLVELGVVMAVIVVLGAMAVSSFSRQLPRSNLNSAASEIQAAMHGARQHALATGHDVWVMVFPQYVSSSGTGRLIVYEDAASTFAAGGALTVGNYDPATLAFVAPGQVVTTVDLPTGIVVGPAAGRGTSATLPAPLAGIDVTRACSFCTTSGDGRGAVRFRPNGSASFYAGSALQTVTGGASMGLNASAVGRAWTLIVTSAAGAVQLLPGG